MILINLHPCDYNIVNISENFEGNVNYTQGGMFDA